jgi:glutamate--cysteine ligase
MTTTARLPVTRDAILHQFGTYGRPRSQWLVGAEFERHLLDNNGRPVPYGGAHGIKWLLERLVSAGWTPTVEEGNLIGVTHPNSSSVTLEPGGQFELSGAPATSISALEAEARGFYELIAKLTAGLDIHQAAIGFTPYADIDDIEWMPKGRYVIMREYLIEKGELAHHMMKGTCAVQASYDFSNEADAARKVALSWRIGPIITAMFANSPVMSGREAGCMSYRGRVWRHTDPDRTGFPISAANFSFVSWVDYLLDVPMMFIKANGMWQSAGGRTFREWTQAPIAGRMPDWNDWELHMTSVFPEVRIKRQIEVRGADCVSLPLAVSFAAMFQGLFYCGDVVDETLALGERFIQHGTPEDRYDEACWRGLEGTIGGRSIASWAEDVLTLAARGLDRCTPEDRHWLRPLEDQVATGESPGAALLRAFRADPSPANVLRAAAYT